MKEHFTHFIFGVCLLGTLLAAVGSVWAFDNNGFETNAVYVPELRRWILKWDGRFWSVRESDGYTDPNYPPNSVPNPTDYGVYLLDGNHWYGVTFSGSGCSDARLFASMTTWHTYRAWGTHTGADNSTMLLDSVQYLDEPNDYQYWGYMYFWEFEELHNYALDGMTVNNLTDGSNGTVGMGTSYNSGYLGATPDAVWTNPPGPPAEEWYTLRLDASGLAGGTDNDFDTGDEYEIQCTPNSKAESSAGVYYGRGYCKPYDIQEFEWGYTYGLHGNDVIIAEYGPAAANEAPQLNYKYLYNDLLLVSPQKVIRLAGTIRFNPLGNSGAGSLFIPVNEDVESDTPLNVYEIDLGLTTVLNTYTGPNVGDEMISIAVNLDDGTLYATAPNLDSPPPVNAYCDAGGTNLCVGGPNNGQSCTDDSDCPDDPVYGDLIAWDTSGGSTSSYTTLVDSDANGGYPNWNIPHFIVYRGTNNPSGRPTILVDFNDTGGVSDPGVLQVSGVEEPAIEFYLDATDANGNLEKRGNPLITGGYILGNGQLDRLTGTIWLVGEKPNNVRGLIGLRNDDSHFRFPGPARWYKFRDVATPGLIVDPPCETPPLIVEVVPDPDPEACAGIEYTRQMELEVGSGVPAPTLVLVSGPTGAVIDPNTG
ncbi:MAG: hypothetical protein JSV03_01975, partial [Planctomycetota bacterium]